MNVDNKLNFEFWTNYFLKYTKLYGSKLDLTTIILKINKICIIIHNIDESILKIIIIIWIRDFCKWEWTKCNNNNDTTV